MSEHLREERRKLLAAALGHVPFDGWAGALKRAAADCGWDAVMIARAFPGGVAELIAFHAAEADRRMTEALRRRDLSRLKIRERIALAVRLRLEGEARHREAIRRALAFDSLPGQGGRALKSLYATVDAMWRGIGDGSTDVNFYTKRALLAGVYAATLVIWVNDRSEGFADSWAFLDRRIADVMRIEKLKARARRFRERLPDPWRFLGRLRYG